jgi:Domain of unknown function DUF11
MYYNSHCSTQSDGCAPKPERASSQPPIQRRNSLARAIALVLMAGTLVAPATSLAATLNGFKYLNADSDPAFSTGDTPYKNHQVLIRNKVTGESFRTATKDDGSYQFVNLPVGDYVISTSFPTGLCLVSAIQHPGFSSATDVKELNLGFGSCQQPLKDACDEPTHTSTGNGDWDKPATWNTGTVPKSGDRVRVEENHVVTVPNSTIVLDEGGLCNRGVLTSAKGSHTVCGQPATPGGDIVIFAREVTNESTGLIETGDGGSTPTSTATGCGWDNWLTIYNECGDGTAGRAGKGGNIEIYTTTTFNDGAIESGNGGNAAAFHAPTVAGDGGLIKIITDVADEKNESRTIALNSGKGGGVCGNNWNVWGPLTPGAAGKIFAELKFISFTEGETHWKGNCPLDDKDDPCLGSELAWDPIKLKATAGLKISDYATVEIYTDEGGSIDLTALKEGAISARVVRIQTKALNGSGGTVDLRGLRGKIFKATTKIEIYADSIQTDAGVDVRDLIDSPEVSVNLGQVAYFVSLTATSLVNGEPNSTVNVPFRINNIGPKSDTYSLAVTSSAGWTLGTLADVTLKGMEVKTINLPVILPAQRGLVDDIVIVATSQTDPSVKRELKLTVQVEPGIDSDGDTYPDSLDAFPSDVNEWRDSDNDGIGNNTDLDDDNDGMSDEWEIKYFVGLNSVVNDAAEDFDKDGYSNSDEFKANTDPTDPNAHPVKITLIPGQGGEPGSGSTETTSVDVTGKITVDNVYGLYHGDSVNINPVGYDGSFPPTVAQWAGAETYNFSAKTTDFIYVAAIDTGGQQGVLAEFSSQDRLIATESPEWQVYFTNVPVTTFPLNTPDVLSQIKQADEGNKWQNTVVGGINGVAPWGTIASIGSTTKWMWKNTGTCDQVAAFGGCPTDDQRLFIFRLPVAALAVKPQIVGKYTAHGTLKDNSGKPLAGILVQIGDKTATTDAAGNWKVEGLTEGDYTVKGALDNFTCLTDVALGNEMYQQEVVCKQISSLKVTAKSTPATAMYQGGKLSYLITATNGSDKTATGVVLNNLNLPQGVEVLGLKPLDGGECDVTSVSCNLPDLAPGTSARVQLELGNVAAGQFHHNIALNATGFPTDQIATWKPVKPYLSTAVACTPNPVVMLSELHCTATAELSSFAPEATATGLKLQFTPSKGTELKAVTTEYGKCEIQDGKAMCDLGELSIVDATQISKVAVEVDLKLVDAGLLVLTSEAKLTATNYAEHAAKSRTQIMIPKDFKAGLVLAIDTTYSMNKFINGVIKGLEQFIENSMKDPVTAPLTVLVEFKDDVRIVTPPTRDMNAVLAGLRSLKVGGGGTCPEASVEAFNLGADYLTDNGVLSIVTNAPPYPDANVDALKQRVTDMTDKGAKVYILYEPECDVKSDVNQDNGLDAVGTNSLPTTP